MDTAKKIVDPVILVQITRGAFPIHTEPGRPGPYYEGYIVHSYNFCGCPFIKEVLLKLNIDRLLFEQLKVGLLVSPQESRAHLWMHVFRNGPTQAVETSGSVGSCQRDMWLMN